MKFKYKKVLILGYGLSGHSVEDVLFYNYIDYLIYDDKMKYDCEKFISKLTKKTLNGVDLAVLSPGISIYSKIVKKLKNLGIKVVSEIEFAYMFCSARIIAVTGTNGKTTTAKLIHHILKNSGAKAQLLGNVGTPFSNIFKGDIDVAVVEVSSFQLEAIEYFYPEIAILLNIAPDHIERHKTFENYVNAKFEIFKNQQCYDKCIVTRDVCKYKNIDDVNAEIYCIGANGINIENNVVYIYYNQEKYEVCNVKDIKINTCIDNVLASILACFLYGIAIRDIVQNINSFLEPEHRLQVIKSNNGVTYINDSKATNIHAMEYAVNKLSNNKVCLMLGGYDKKLDFNKFILNMPSNITELVLFSEAGGRISKVCKRYGYKNFVYFKTLAEAISYVKNNVQSGTTVLFSPANSSFDEFTSYKERGEFFINNIR